MYSFLELFSGTANTSSFKEMGRSKVETIKNFSQTVFKPDTITPKRKKFVICFPGKFQPFHKGHFVTYKMLKRMFGDDSIFILPSAYKKLPFDPLTFDQRKGLILSSNGMTINPNNIKPRRSIGFNYIGLAKDLGIINQMSEYIFICVLSVEDTKLMPTKDKVTYYQPWPAELYNATISELSDVSKYLPAMDKYGFKFTVDAFGSEILYDYGKEKREKNFLKTQVLIEIGFGMLRDKAENGDLEEIQKYLPYDIELLKEMRSELQYVGDEDAPTEDDKNKEIELKKELIQAVPLER